MAHHGRLGYFYGFLFLKLSVNNLKNKYYTYIYICKEREKRNERGGVSHTQRPSSSSRRSRSRRSGGSSRGSSRSRSSRSSRGSSRGSRAQTTSQRIAALEALVAQQNSINELKARLHRLDPRPLSASSSSDGGVVQWLGGMGEIQPSGVP